MRLGSLVLHVAAALALPLNQTDEPTTDALIPKVKIANGTVIGLQVGLIENFKGIPFAQPPEGPLRLKPPQPLKRSFGVFTNQLIPNSCPQFFTQIDRTNLPSSTIGLLANSPLIQEASQQSEDCLNLSVQRPVGTTGKSKLPVVVWFFGGAFEFGSTQLYDATDLITKSIELNQPVIYVAVNYRIGK
jgi:carboxylesterase type B